MKNRVTRYIIGLVLMFGPIIYISILAMAQAKWLAGIAMFCFALFLMACLIYKEVKDVRPKEKN